MVDLLMVEPLRLSAVDYSWTLTQANGILAEMESSC